MSSKIEKAARDLANLHGNRDNWRSYLQDARIVARALRQPDEGMLAAGERAIFHADPDWQSNACWRAMIDHLLSEAEAKT